MKYSLTSFSEKTCVESLKKHCSSLPVKRKPLKVFAELFIIEHGLYKRSVLRKCIDGLEDNSLDWIWSQAEVVWKEKGNS